MVFAVAASTGLKFREKFGSFQGVMVERGRGKDCHGEGRAG